jgi:hypothetical protein
VAEEMLTWSKLRDPDRNSIYIGSGPVNVSSYPDVVMV